jgi:hypothetical protein
LSGVLQTEVEVEVSPSPTLKIDKIQAPPEVASLPLNANSLDPPADTLPEVSHSEFEVLVPPTPMAQISQPVSEEIPPPAMKPSVEFRKPAATLAKTTVPAIPLSKLSDFLPSGEKWDKRWEGETEADHKQRTSKQRSEWISWYTSTMKKGTTKAKKALQFYQDLAKSGQPPQLYQKPHPVEIQGSSQLAIFEQLTGTDWTLRWEGEPEALWRERYLMGKPGWLKHMEQVMKSSVRCHKEKKKFYGHLIAHQSVPRYYEGVPDLEDHASIADKQISGAQQLAEQQKIRDQESWRKHTRKEVHQTAWEWQVLIRQGHEPPTPHPHYDEDWKNSWWLAYWDEEYAKFKEIHLCIIKEQKAAKKAKLYARYQDKAKECSELELRQEILRTPSAALMLAFFKEWSSRITFPDQAPFKFNADTKDLMFPNTSAQQIVHLSVNQIGQALYNVILAKRNAPLRDDQVEVERALWGELERLATIDLSL